MNIVAFPLAWHLGWKRTPADQQTAGRLCSTRTDFKADRRMQDFCVATATGRLFDGRTHDDYPA